MGQEPGHYVTSTTDQFSSQDTQLSLTDSTSFSLTGAMDCYAMLTQWKLCLAGELIWTGKVGIP